MFFKSFPDLPTCDIAKQSEFDLLVRKPNDEETMNCQNQIAFDLLTISSMAMLDEYILLSR